MSASVFPAYVGMSPTSGHYHYGVSGVPRIRGDEPVIEGSGDYR